MDIVSWTLGKGRNDQNKPIYIDATDPTRYISAQGTTTLVRKLVAGLRHNGLQNGDTVCVLSFNDIHYTSLYLGIIGSGGCFTGANPGYTARELGHHLQMTGAKFLLTELKTLNIAVDAAAEVGLDSSKIFVLNYQDEEIASANQSWHMLLSHGEQDWVQIKDPNTTAAYVSTSGTSGLPKAAIIPHSYLISQAEFQEKSFNTKQQASQLVAVPPFHVFTIPVQHGLPLRRGVSCYIMPRFEPIKFLAALENFSITQTITVPPIMMALSKASSSQLQTLRRILVGGSCATGGMQQQLYDKLPPKARIVQVYGMTEVGWATMWGKKNADRTGSVGQPLPGTLLRAVDLRGHPISKDGRTGNIQIHTPCAMRGYLNNPVATAETITSDGWVMTGDVGYVRDGNWYIIDRTKDLIKVRGWQVSPAEIEAALLEHADVTDAGVIGVAAKDGSGEIPMAYIVKSASSFLSEVDVKDFLAGRLARYKGVDEVRFVDRIPRNPTGKILRRVLRDARGTQPVTSDQQAAEAYANALKGFVSSQKPRNWDDGGHGHHSRSDSLTSSSTIDSVGPLTPNLIEAPPAPLTPAKSKKRKCGLPSPESTLSSSVTSSKKRKLTFPASKVNRRRLRSNSGAT